MVDLLLPPDDDGSAREHPRSQRRRRRSVPPKPPEVDELLHRLGTLLGLIAMGTFSVAKGNTLARVLGKMVDVQLRRQQATPGNSVEAPDVLIEACRANPELLKSIEPLLTDEQLAQILGEDVDAKRAADED